MNRWVVGRVDLAEGSPAGLTAQQAGVLRAG